MKSNESLPSKPVQENFQILPHIEFREEGGIRSARISESRFQTYRDDSKFKDELDKIGILDFIYVTDSGVEYVAGVEVFEGKLQAVLNMLKQYPKEVVLNLEDEDTSDPDTFDPDTLD